VDDADLERFGEFVATSRGALLVAARRLVPDHALAEDLVQTALERTFASWDRIRAVEAAGAYCRRAMLTTCISWQRRRWTGERPTGELPEEAGEDVAGRIDDSVMLGAALARLSQRCRVAELLGCSVGSVRSAATRGLAKLRADAGLTSARG
jgi:DNA-directed RNA polymerase specialized sigma24 family protein